MNSINQNILQGLNKGIDLAEEKYTSTYKMQKVNELYASIDSLEKRLFNQYNSFSENFYKRTGVFNFQTRYNRPFEKNSIDITNYTSILSDFDFSSQKSIINSVENN